jgi:hypothetical protein
MPSEVKMLYAIVSNPSGRGGDTGRACQGYFAQDGNTVTMTDENGIPIRDVEGERITHELQTGERADVIAKRLTLKIFRALRGDDVGGFNRERLSYPKWSY